VTSAKEKMKEEMLGEHRRLLYVALTRARERLYVCGFQNKVAPREGTWYRLAEQAAQSLGVPLTHVEGHGFGHLGEEKVAAESAAAPETQPPPSWAMRSAPRPVLKPRLIRPSDALDGNEPPALSPLSARFHRGNVVHALLARLPDLPREKRRAAALVYAKAQGFDEALVDETLAVLDHPDFAAAFAPGSRAEAGFLAALPELGPGAEASGRIDRLAVTAQEVLILDFKTNRPPPADEQAVGPIYLAQMALYRAAAARLYPGRRIVCGLLFTDGPRLIRLSDGILDRQMGELARRLDPEGAHS